MRRLLDRMVDRILRLTRWYDPMAIRARERHTDAVVKVALRHVDPAQMDEAARSYRERLTGRVETRP
jgi:hypothetical protein